MYSSPASVHRTLKRLNFYSATLAIKYCLPYERALKEREYYGR